jgi:PAS domain S-box-containing protein
VTDDAQHILQRALLGEAMDCAEGTAVFVWNEERKYVAINEHACRLVGLSREELIGMPVGELSPDHASRELALTRDAQIVRSSSSFTRRDGTEIPITWVTIRTRVAGLPYMVSLVWPTS